MVDRLGKSLNLTFTGPFVILYGYVDDIYLTEDLKKKNIEQLLWDYLKSHGFTRIVYFNMAQMLYFLDDKSYHLTLHNTQTTATKNEEKVEDRRPLGNRKLFKRDIAKEVRYRDHVHSKRIGKKIIKNIRANELNAIEILEAIYKDPHIKTAVIFSQFDEMFFTNPKAQIEFTNRLTEWYRYENSLNKCFFIFHAFDIDDITSSSLEKRIHLISHLIPSRNVQRIKLENFVFITTPQEDEIWNLVNYYRLMHEIDIDWRRIDILIRWMEVERMPLRYWWNQFENLRLGAKELNLDNVRGWFKKSKLTESTSAMDRLERLIGLKNVKEQIKKQIALVRLAKKNNNTTLLRNIRLHMAFVGNPGTGKTTVARLLAEIYREEGVLKRGHLIETDREGLVAEYVGHTAIKTDKVCREALDGVLLVDEAYSLKQHENDSFGQEAIDTLMKRMEDWKERFVVIFTGYPEKIEEFLKSNPGLKRRIGAIIRFDDYTPDELLEIFLFKLKELNLRIEEELGNQVRIIFENLYLRRTQEFGNAGEVEKLIQKLMENHSLRCFQSKLDCQVEPLRVIDLPEEYKNLANSGVDETEFDKAMKELEKLVGLSEVKRSIKDLVSRIRYEEKLVKIGIKKERDKPNLNFVFKGNPGTGKTTVARIMGKIFKALGLLTSGHIIEVSRKDLVAGYVGQTAEKTAQAIRKALDGILFIDEAHDLVIENDAFGKEAVGTLVKNMEDYKDRLIVIVAGYPEEIDKFIRSNPGLSSRFTHYIEFKDYSESELWRIFELMLTQRGYSIEGGSSREKFINYITFLQKSRGKRFGNARDVRVIVDKVIDSLAKRVFELERQGKSLSKRDLTTVTPDDIPNVPYKFDSATSKGEKINIFIPKINEKISIDIPDGLIPSVGMVFAKTPLGESTGTGFLISPSGHVVTCYHVIENSLEILFLKEPEKELRYGTLVVHDSSKDLAIIKIDYKEAAFLEMEDSRSFKVKIGSKVGLLSFPLGEALGTDVTYTEGIISSFKKDENGVSLLQITADAAYGSSGGPVFDINTGKVVGVLKGGINKNDITARFNFAIDIRELFSLVNVKLRNG